jgi:hypothetical protein
MQLNQEQLKAFDDDGFLLLQDRFSPSEVDVLQGELPSLFAEDSERRVLEKGTDVVRSVYGCHATNEVFRRLACHPRLVEPAMQILGGPVYVYQFKVNAKIAFVGDVWEWHQDFIFWQREDGVENPQLVTIAIFLDEVTEFNGPLLFVPGSHHVGVIEPPRTGGVPEGYEGSPDWISNLTADLKYSVGKSSLAQLVSKGGLTAPKGPAGSALFFHCNTVHGSAPNMSPFDRKIVLVTYNRVDNAPRKQKRPEFLVSRDFTPITSVADNALQA